jgi:mono/diheme cytochrome c family protein
MKILSIALVIACSLADAAQAQTAAPADGKTLFAKNCAACHQANGRGIPGAFPALVASPVATGPVDGVADVLLKGRGGMPDFSASLNDTDIAAVLTYARSSWGNHAPPVASAEIQARRVALQVAPAGDNRFGNKH